MNTNSAFRLFLLSIALLSWKAHAEASNTVQSEIDFLLENIGDSGCAFNRNGTWYDSKRAQSYLRDRYATVLLSESIVSTEDFIEKVATQSNSGQAYEVRCRGVVDVTSNRWLRDELLRHRDK